MRPAMAAAARRPAGFTLVEVVVALALLSAIMLGLVSAMVTLGTTSDKLEQRADRGGERRLVSAFLQATLSQSSKTLRHRSVEGGEQVFFAGAAQELRWLGNMPARHGVGGLHHLRLFLADEPQGTVLVLQYTPFTGVDALPDWSLAASHRLVERVTAFSLAYESRPTPAEPLAHWSDAWPGGELLPARVRVGIAVDGLAWPPLWITIRAPDASGGERIVHGPVS